MSKKVYEQVSDGGSGIIRLGDVSVEGNWDLDGLQLWIETTCLDGNTSRIKGVMEYGKYTIWFDETPSEDDLPNVGTTTLLMIDDKKIGGDATWWVISYLTESNKLGVELCNRPNG